MIPIVKQIKIEQQSYYTNTLMNFLSLQVELKLVEL